MNCGVAVLPFQSSDCRVAWRLLATAQYRHSTIMSFQFVIRMIQDFTYRNSLSSSAARVSMNERIRANSAS